MKIQILKTSDLNNNLIQTITTTWRNEFGGGNINPKSIFFIPINKEKIVALGSLTPVQINHLCKTYNFQGIGGIVSLEKGKGFGKMLMSHITTYLKNHDMIGIGVCKRKNKGFYEKCNFFVYTDLVSQLQRKTTSGKYEGQPDGDVDILISQKSTLVKDMLERPQEKVTVPFWW